MSFISRKQALDYLRRWSLVEQAELSELRSTGLAIKLRQVSVLMASQRLFPEDPDRESELQEVRERWRRIHEALRG